jgi:hypothetical protein
MDDSYFYLWRAALSLNPDFLSLTEAEITALDGVPFVQALAAVGKINSLFLFSVPILIFVVGAAQPFSHQGSKIVNR